MAKQPKRIQAWTGDREAAHAVADAIALVKANAKYKFDESIEISVNLGVDPRLRRPTGPRRREPAVGHRPRRPRRRLRQGRQGG